MTREMIEMTIHLTVIVRIEEMTRKECVKQRDGVIEVNERRTEKDDRNSWIV
jgi:hypothetical protein